MKKITTTIIIFILFLSFSFINAQELFTNADFNTDVNGWTISDEATLTWETNGYAKLTKGAGDTWNSRIGQVVNGLEIGKEYIFKLNIIELSGKVRIYNSDFGWMGYVYHPGIHCFNFTATQETTIFRWYAYEDEGDYNIVDYASLKKNATSTNSTPTYYVDATNGSDDNNGTSENTAWKTLSKVRFSAMSYNPGDIIAFKRGETFNGLRLYFNELHGTATNPIVFTAYGTGEKPIITMLKTYNPTWINDGSNRWHTVIPNVATRLWKNNIELKRTCGSKFQNSAIFHLQLPVSELNNVKREFGGPEGALWVYSDGTAAAPHISGWPNPNNEKRLYYYATSSPSGTFVGNSNPYAFGLDNSSYITIQNLDLQGAVDGALLIKESNNILIKSCSIGKQSDSGIVVKKSNNVSIEQNLIDADFQLNYTGFLSYRGTDYRGTSDGVGIFGNSSNNEIYFNDFFKWGHAAIGMSAFSNDMNNNNIHHNFITVEGISYGRFFGVSGNANNNEIHHNYIKKTRTQSQLGGHHNNIHHNIWDEMHDEDFKYGQYANAVSFEANGHLNSENNRFAYNTIQNVEGAGVAFVSYNDKCINNIVENNLIIDSGEINGLKKSIFITDSEHIYNNTIINNAIINSNTNNTVFFRGLDNLTVSQFNTYNGNNLFSLTGNNTNFTTGVDVITGNINYNPNDDSVGAGDLTIDMIGLAAYPEEDSTNCTDCSGTSIANISVTNISSNSATITWEGNPNATTWLYVHELDSTGPQHPATGNTYTYSTLGANYTFTVFVQGENNCDEPTSMEFSTFNSTASISSNKINNIFIYPNPATRTLTIIQNQLELKNYTITNMIGQKVASDLLNNQTIDISKLENGIYFIELFNDKQSITQKFIKQ